MSYKGKTPYQYDRSSRSFNEGAWKNWPKLFRERDGRIIFPAGPLMFDKKMLADRQRRQFFTDPAPRFRFNGKGDTKFLKGQ